MWEGESDCIWNGKWKYCTHRKEALLCCQEQEYVNIMFTSQTYLLKAVKTEQVTYCLWPYLGIYGTMTQQEVSSFLRSVRKDTHIQEVSVYCSSVFCYQLPLASKVDGLDQTQDPSSQNCGVKSKLSVWGYLWQNKLYCKGHLGFRREENLEPSCWAKSLTYHLEVGKWKERTFIHSWGREAAQAQVFLV